jgi:hypothetical protein
MSRELRAGEGGLATPDGVEEPWLTVRRPRRFFLRRRFLRAVVPCVVLAIAGFVALLGFGNLGLPFERLVILEGKMGSKADLFDDEQVQRILLRHHVRVHATRLGSRDAAISDFTATDFEFPSGRPAAELILQRRRSAGQYITTYWAFVSPIVLATYREYAETLRRNGVATPRAGQGADSLYYDLDFARFLDLIRRQKTWDQLGIRELGVSNGNRALAQSPSACQANSGATYLGLVAYAVHGRAPTTEHEAVDLANEIKPLLREQGLSPTVPAELYYVPEGRLAAPIIVIYEHQYLAYQARFAQRSGRPDDERVLLYPSTVFETQPELLALDPDGDRLGELLNTDPQLRRRALELGFRVLDSTGLNSSDQLQKVLAEQGVPVPPAGSSETRAVLPEAPLLEKMISIVGDC